MYIGLGTLVVILVIVLIIYFIRRVVEGRQLSTGRTHVSKSEELRMDGTADDLKGRAKEAVGDLTDNDDLKHEGKADRASGKVKDAIDDVKDKAEDVVDSLKDKAHRD